MGRLAVVLFVAIMGTSCAMAKDWQRPPGVDDLTYKQHRYQCMKDTGYAGAVELPAGQAFMQGVAGASQPRLTQQQHPLGSEQMFIACMEALGYQLK